MPRDADKIRTVLTKHFGKLVPDATLDRVATEISGLEEEWEEIPDVEKVVGASISVQCEDICKVGELYKLGTPIRIFRKKGTAK
ncbi:MAG TPA: hypothetical protein VI895_01505 [Bdellovibrionota bacterium]|nr:hypothetical protein [Bdellovibrionota bacterium]